MSDEDETRSGTGRGWYGSLDGAGTKSSPVVIPDDGNDTPPASNIHTSSEYMELDEPEILDEKKALLEEFERKRRARLLHVPTDDVEVKQKSSTFLLQSIFLLFFQ